MPRSKTSVTEDTAAAFAALVAEGRTPPAVWKASRCRACSLLELCRPKAMAKSALGFREQALAAALEPEPAAVSPSEPSADDAAPS
jgi:CRISPR-associated exonuclease Cas4